MAIDPNDPFALAMQPPVEDAGWGWQWLKALDEPVPVPAPAAPAVPVDTVLVPPPGSNERRPSEPPPPPPPPQQQAGPTSAASVTAEVAAPEPVPLPAPALPSAPAPTGAITTTAQDAPPPPVDPLAAIARVNEIANEAVDKSREQRAIAPFLESSLDKPEDSPFDRFIVDLGARAFDTTPENLEKAYIAQRAAMYEANPDAMQMADLNRQIAAEKKAAARAADLEKQNLERAEKDLRDHQKARELAAANLAGQEAEAKVIAESGWSDGSTGKAIAGILAAVAGAIFQVRNGGPNLALNAMERAIDQDMQRAREQRATARDDYGRDMATAEGDYEFATKQRLAAYDRIAGEIVAEAQKYDPRGQIASRLAKAYGEIQGRKAQFIRQSFEQGIKDQLSLLDVADKQAGVEGKLLANAKAAGRLGGGGTANPDKVPQTAAYWKALGYANVPPERPEGWTRQQLEDWARGQKLDNEVTAGARASGVSDEDRKRLVGDLTQPDGSPFLANGSDTEIATLKGRYQAAHTVARALDNVLALRTGWTSDYVKSPEWQRVKQEFTTALAVGKDVLGLGALSGPDMDLIMSFLGGADPTGMRDPSPGIKQARESVLNLVRDNLKGAGYQEPGRFTIPNLANLKKRESTPQDKQLTSMLGWDTNSQLINKSAQVIASMPGDHTDESIRANQRGYSDAQKRYAEGFAKTLKDPNASPEKKDAARASLKQIEQQALSPGYQAFAKSLTAEKKFDITNPPAPYEADYQAFKDWYQRTYDRPFLDDRDFPTIRPEGQ